MGEHLADVLLKTGDVLHWLEKYTAANACTLLSRFLRVRDIQDLDALEHLVTEAEAEEEREAARKLKP